MYIQKKAARLSVAVLLSIVTPLLAALPALAGSLSDVSGLSATGGSAGLGGGSTDIAYIVGRIIGAALGLVGALFVALVVYAGFLWMTAQGNDERIKQAKKILSGAVIGIVLTFSAYAITSFVTSSLNSALSGGPADQDGQLGAVDCIPNDPEPPPECQ